MLEWCHRKPRWLLINIHCRYVHCKCVLYKCMNTYKLHTYNTLDQAALGQTKSLVLIKLNKHTYIESYHIRFFILTNIKTFFTIYTVTNLSWHKSHLLFLNCTSIYRLMWFMLLQLYSNVNCNLSGLKFF